MTDVVPMMDADGQHLESDEELRSLFAAIDDYAIYTLTPEGMIHSWNPGAERLHGSDVQWLKSRTDSVGMATPEETDAGSAGK